MQKVLQVPTISVIRIRNTGSRPTIRLRVRRSGYRRYWKNMYGYRLGEDDSSGPNVYYHVTFGVSSTVFTYPEWTVRQDELFDQIYLTKLHGYVR